MSIYTRSCVLASFSALHQQEKPFASLTEAQYVHAQDANTSAAWAT